MSLARSHQALKEYRAGILAAYVPCTRLTAQNLKKLAGLKRETLAIMHASKGDNLKHGTRGCLPSRKNCLA
jgi:hypothetical protein